MRDYGRFHIDNAALTGPNPATLHRLSLWKRAAITVSGRPDWLFIKLHCHGMDPRDEEAILGAAMLNFVQELTDGAQGRNEVVHFVSAREMVNIILAACDGREGTPGDYLDYRLRRVRPASSPSPYRQTSAVALKG
jgi:hypothetical protein